MEDRDLFLMSQMSSAWARGTFSVGTVNTSGPDVASSPSHIYGDPGAGVYTDILSPPQMQSQSSITHIAAGEFQTLPPATAHLLQLQPCQPHQQQLFQQCIVQCQDILSDRSETAETSSAFHPKKQTSKISVAEKEDQKKRRKSNPAEWKKVKSKYHRERGEEYITSSGKLKKARSVQPIDCSKCRFRCSEKIPEETRQAIHTLYWNLGSYERQRAFIAQHVEQNEVKPSKSKTSTRREVANSFFLIHNKKEFRVCKAFFTKTLDVGNKVIDYTLKKTESGVYVGKDERGRKDPGNKTKPEDADFVKSHISSFPCADGRYGKKDNKSRKKYLPQDLNVGKMYKMYQEKCEELGKKPVSVSVYRNIFKKDFNLSFSKPRKEHCANCNCGNQRKKRMKESDKTSKITTCPVHPQQELCSVYSHQQSIHQGPFGSL